MYEYLDISLDIYHYYRSEEEQPGSVSELELSTNLREVFRVPTTQDLPLLRVHLWNFAKFR